MKIGRITIASNVGGEKPYGVRFYYNSKIRRVRLIWAGPLFILVAPR